MKKVLVAMTLLVTLSTVVFVNTNLSTEKSDEQIVLDYLHSDGKTNVDSVDIFESDDEMIEYVAYDNGDLVYGGSVSRDWIK